MYRGGGKGGCWASFSPTWFWRPRLLPSRSTLCLSPHLSSSVLSLSLIPLPTTCSPQAHPAFHFRYSQCAATDFCLRAGHSFCLTLLRIYHIPL